MADFIAKWSIFCSLHAALLNITFKPDILNISLFPQIFVMTKEKDKFYKSLKVTYLKATQEERSHRTYILILKLKETSTGCFVDLFICRLIYDMFLFNY